jgi:hypothetical protein
LRKQDGEFQKDKGDVKLPNTGHLSRAQSEVTRRNEENHENVEAAGNTDSSAASGDSAHLSLIQNECS